MDAAPKSALGDATNAPPPPAAKPPRPAADKPRRVVTWYHPTLPPPPPPPRAAELLRPAPPAAPPKESSSAFVFFGRATRDDIKAAHPDWSLGAVGRELSKRWQALDDAAKKPFHELAAADKERYEREKAAYEAYEAANQPAPVVAENVPLNEAPSPREPACREFSPTAADVADADAALKKMEVELAATLEAAPPPAAATSLRRSSDALRSYVLMRDAARRARNGQRPATRLRANALFRPSLGDVCDDDVEQVLVRVDPPPRKKRKKKKRANHGIDSLGRPNRMISDAAMFIECEEGTPYKPGPAVPGAKELVADEVPEECLGYPDYKKKRGANFFIKGEQASTFYKENGYWKIAVYGHRAYSSKAVVKFFKEVARA